MSVMSVYGIDLDMGCVRHVWKSGKRENDVSGGE